VSSLQHPSSRGPIDYPELASAPVLRPPPVAASPASERRDSRPPQYQPPQPVVGTVSAGGVIGGQLKPPRINSDYPVTYWGDVQIGTSGLKNMGNTCYMNAPIQCLSATVPFARFFTGLFLFSFHFLEPNSAIVDGRWKTAINFTNKMGSQGKLVQAFAKLLHEMWGGDLPYLTPLDFRVRCSSSTGQCPLIVSQRSICQLSSQYIGSDQHDSQEFLSFLLDGIHEDLNRVMISEPKNMTAEEEEELNRLPPAIASDREWRAWKAKNDSLIVDFFQGQFRSRLQCLTCKKVSKERKEQYLSCNLTGWDRLRPPTTFSRSCKFLSRTAGVQRFLSKSVWMDSSMRRS